MDDWRIELPAHTHLRSRFDCGQPSLNDFLRTLVSQYEKRHLGRTYVAVRGPDPQVFGYYTIASSAVAFDHLPAEAAQKLPRHPLPVVLVARLAVDRAVQGQRLGEKLMLDALARSLELSDELGIHAVVVDAIDQQAKAFYQKYRFIPLLDSEFHLYLPITTIHTLLKP
jgi:predicted GNAT family N-acyltransferase